MTPNSLTERRATQVTASGMELVHACLPGYIVSSLTPTPEDAAALKIGEGLWKRQIKFGSYLFRLVRMGLSKLQEDAWPQRHSQINGR